MAGLVVSQRRQHPEDEIGRQEGGQSAERRRHGRELPRRLPRQPLHVARRHRLMTEKVSRVDDETATTPPSNSETPPVPASARASAL